MDVENGDFLEFVATAERNRLDYILIGGLALLLNGVVRFTKDVDVWLQPTNENRDRFINVLLELGYDEEDLQPMREANFTEPQMIRLDFGPLYVMTRVHFRLNYDECRQRAKEHNTIRGNKTYFLHINDLREAKILARRPKDLFDVIEIDNLIEERKRLDNENSGQ